MFREKCEWFGFCRRYDRANDSLLPSPFTGPSTNTCGALLQTWNVWNLSLQAEAALFQDAHRTRGVCPGSQPPVSSGLGAVVRQRTCTAVPGRPLLWFQTFRRSWLPAESSNRPDLSGKGKPFSEISKGFYYLRMKPQVLTLWSGFLGSHLTCSLTPLILLSQGKCLNVPPWDSIF